MMNYIYFMLNVLRSALILNTSLNPPSPMWVVSPDYLKDEESESLRGYKGLAPDDITKKQMAAGGTKVIMNFARIF